MHGARSIAAVAAAGWLGAQAPHQFERSALPGIQFPLATDAVFGDFDADGDRDLFLIASWQPKLYRNDGAGQFADVTAALPPLPANLRTAAFVDGDGDGRDDLLLGFSLQARWLRSLPGGGWLDRTADLPPGLPTVHGAVAGDFDRDGDADLACAGHVLDGGQNQLLWNDGTGRFTATQPCPGSSFQVLAQDIDGDGDLDLLLSRNGISLWRNDGGGVFTDVTATQLPAGLGTPANAAFGDADGDGAADLVLGQSGLGDVVLRNDGSGGFAPLWAGVPLGPGVTTTVALADVDADGDLDWLRGTTNAGAPSLWLNDGGGGFTDASWRLPALPALVCQLRAADLDGDRDPDAVFTSLGNPAAVLWNLHRHVAVPVPPVVGGTAELLLASQPGYGPGGRIGVLGLGLARLSPPVELPPFGALGLDLTAPLWQLPAAFGAGDPPVRFPVPVPAQPALQGLPLYLQGLVEEAPGAAPRFTALWPTAIR